MQKIVTGTLILGQQTNSRHIEVQFWGQYVVQVNGCMKDVNDLSDVSDPLLKL